ncbi:MAG: PorP/SprF family type IX secretion system membrane protein [Vicingus serpentipes]|nr:PorP/SprF family type IX secretion system membrane protein [Vicingus serpentipes]
MKKYTLHITLLLSLTLNFKPQTSKLFAQDIHFTMYDAVPMLTNPATTGIFNGDHRGVINYRSQWASIGKPYVTYSVNIDGGFFKHKWKNGYLGMGLGVYKDVAGESQLGITKINLSLSSIVYLDNKNSAAVGLMGSWAQNSMNPENLRWDVQFDGQQYNPALSSNEAFTFESNNYFDFSAGALWTYGTGTKTLSSHDELASKAGIAFYHVTRPSQQINFGEIDKLYSKWAFHSESYIGISNSRLALVPKTLFYFQGPTREFTLGLLARYILRDESLYTGLLKEMAISMGGYYRVGDAFVPSIEFELSSFAVGFSYDLNVSGLTRASGGNGGPEIFIRMINPNPFQYGRGNRSSARFR